MAWNGRNVRPSNTGVIAKGDTTYIDTHIEPAEAIWIGCDCRKEQFGGVDVSRMMKVEDGWIRGDTK